MTELVTIAGAFALAILMTGAVFLGGLLLYWMCNAIIDGSWK